MEETARDEPTHEALWNHAQRCETQGDPGGALGAYKALAERLIEEGQPVPALLADRLGTVCNEVGDHDGAIAVFFAARSRMQQVGDAYGNFMMTLKLAETCLGAADWTSAGLFLDEVLSLDAGASSVVAHVRAIRWPKHGATENALARVAASLTLARLWAATGQFGAAIEATKQALALLSGAEKFFDRSSIGVFLAELHLDRGDAPAALKVEGAHRPAASADSTEEARWNLVGARRQLLQGQLSNARRALEAIVRRAGPPRRLDLLAVWLLASLDARLNRVGEARSAISCLRERLLDHPFHLPWNRDLDALAVLLERKRVSASLEVALPFVPEQVAEELQRDDEWEVSAPPRALVAGREPAHRVEERFADRWASTANRVRLALDEGNREMAAQRLADLSAMTVATDSPRLTARTRYLEAIIMYYTAEYGAAQQAALGCLEEARRERAPLDELDYLELLTWTSARLGRAEEHIHWSKEAKARLDSLLAGLDEDDRRYFTLNQMSRQDAFLAARIESLRSLKKCRIPIASIAAWVDERRRRRATIERFREVNQLVGWDLTRRLASDNSGDPPSPVAGPTPENAATSDQVEAWVSTQVELGRRTRRTGSAVNLATSRWPLRRIPRGVAVIQFYAVADRLFAFLLQRGDVVVHTVPTTRVELDDAVRALTAAMMEQAGGGDESDVTRALDRLATDLGLQWIIEPLHRSIDRLVIIPHDTLVHAPFAALPVDGDERLCERFVLSFAPSLAWLDPTAAARSTSTHPSSFLGVAVRDYPGTEMPPLLQAVKEIEAADAVLRGRGVQTVSLTGSGARQEAVLDALARAEIVLFACHGVFDRTAPHRSRLFLAGANRDTTGCLTLADIQIQDLRHLWLAVLGACWTGSTAVLPGGELVCLPAAFLRAGARGVLTPLWAIGDASNREFMEEFFAALMHEPSPHALAKVQRAWLRDRRRIPFRWAGYMHHGQG